MREDQETPGKHTAWAAGGQEDFSDICHLDAQEETISYQYSQKSTKSLFLVNSPSSVALLLPTVFWKWPVK